ASGVVEFGMKCQGRAVIPVGRAADRPVTDQPPLPAQELEQRLAGAEGQLIDVAELQILRRIIGREPPVVARVEKVLVPVGARVIVELLGKFVVANERKAERGMLLDSHEAGVPLVPAPSVVTVKLEALVLRVGLQRISERQIVKRIAITQEAGIDR